MSLQFAHVEYSMSTRSLDIFVIGCDAKPRCVGCFNNELWDWNLSGIDYQQVITKCNDLVKSFNNLIDRIILVGGDCVDAYLRYKEYLVFVQEIKKLGKPIYLFTHYELNEIPKELLQEVDYVKTGRYLPELTCDNNICYGIKLATSNQKIWRKGVDFE